MSDPSPAYHPSSQLSLTDAESLQQAINGETSPGSFAVICPFLKVIEQDSVFIDLTAIKNLSLLNKALLKFNEGAMEDDMYEEFLSYRSKPRYYLGRAFLKAMWRIDSEDRKALINDDIALEDATFFKGFSSYPSDATSIKLTLDSLPYLPALQLKEEMAARLSCFGDVLDHDISRTNGIYQGEWYAALNLTVPFMPGL